MWGYPTQILSLGFSCYLFNSLFPRPPSNTGQGIGSKEQAEPVVVLDPVSTHEPQTKDQVMEKDPAQHKKAEGEMKPEYKETSSGKTQDSNSSIC